MLKRKGRFYVCSKLIEDSPETVLLALKDVLVLKADYNVFTDKYEFWALSTLFDEVAEGHEIPLYDIEIIEINGKAVASIAERLA